MRTYGFKTGDMPQGSMSWTKKTYLTCQGYPKGTATWVINYEFPSGINYQGDGRTAYIPDTEEGREVLALLVKAFRRKLTFTIGFSVVRGKYNCIVWNGIHHKTNTHGGSTRYGYPDPTYFNRVK